MKTSTFPVALAAGVLLSSSSYPVFADQVDFEGLPAGTVVSTLSRNKGISGNLTGVVLVEGHNTLFPGPIR